MYKNSLTILFLILFTICGYSQATKIVIKSDGIKESNYLKMDNFYLTHYLYIDLFLRESLFVDANKEDVSAILGAIKKYVSEGNPLEVEVEKPGEINYKIKVVILNKDDMELLIVFTNWNPKKKLFEKEIEKDSYTRWYFLNGNKMTYRKDMSKENNYSELNKVDLINTYLFDELTENDTQIKSTAEEILKEKDLSVKDKIMTNLILLKYYIFKGEIEKINRQVEYLKGEFIINKTQPDLKGLEAALKATEFQIELIDLMK